jgi:hypothetical protein
MRTVISAAIGLFCLLAAGGAWAAPGKGPEFAISYPAAQSTGPLDGRIILLLSRDMSREPRTHVEANEPLASPYLFGLNVSGLAPATDAVLNDNAFGWPAAHLSAIPTGDYFVQAVLNRYEAFHLADGRTLKLPPDKGEGQQWAKKDGQFVFDADQAARGCGASRENRADSGPTDWRHRREDRQRVCAAHPNPQRAAVQVLGPRCIHRRARVGAQGV